MTTTGDRQGSPILGLLGEEVASVYEKSRKRLDEATSLRVELERLETPVRDAEERVRSKSAKGRRWKTLLADLKAAVKRAGGQQLRVHRREQASLEEFRGTVERIKQVAKGDETELPPRTIEALEKVLRLRASEVEWLDGAIRHARRIAGLSGEATPDEVAEMLVQRRSYMERVGSLRSEAEKLERAVLQIPVRAPGAVPNGGEGVLDALLDGAAYPNGHGGAGVSSALTQRFAELEQEIRDVHSLARREHDEVSRRTAERIQHLRAEHAEALAEEIRARRSAEAEIEKHAREVSDLAAQLEEAGRVEGELTERRAALEKRLEAKESELEHAKHDFEAREREIQAASKEVESRAADAEAALRIRVEELTQERSELAGRVESVEKAEAEARETLREKEAALDAERDKLAKERDEVEKRVRAAQRERDEALVLINSLTKRLGLPEKGEPREE